MSTVAVNKISTDSISNDCSKFKIISSAIAELGASVGIRIIPFHNENLEHFSKLNEEARLNILHSIQIYLNVYKAVQAEGASLLDSTRVVWSALSQLGYRPTSDLFSFITSGNVIEIHDHQFIQVFRNLNFFKYCSYSLEQLYCFKMHDLYTRDEAFEKDLMRYAQILYNPETKSVVKTELKPHIISELISPERLNIADTIHYMAPLFALNGGSNTIASITIETAQLVSYMQAASTAEQIHQDNSAVNNIYTLKPQPSVEQT